MTNVIKAVPRTFIQQRFLSPCAVQHSAGCWLTAFLWGFLSTDLAELFYRSIRYLDILIKGMKAQLNIRQHQRTVQHCRFLPRRMHSTDGGRVAYHTRLGSFDFLYHYLPRFYMYGNKYRMSPGAKHGFVQCFCKRSLHGDQVCR